MTDPRDLKGALFIVLAGSVLASVAGTMEVQVTPGRLVVTTARSSREAGVAIERGGPVSEQVVFVQQETHHSSCTGTSGALSKGLTLLRAARFLFCGAGRASDCS